jgi:ABC-type branched-subunit amino acid transport system substrate-binding protein
MKISYAFDFTKRIIIASLLLLFGIQMSMLALAEQESSKKKVVVIGSSMPITGHASSYGASAHGGLFAALYDFNMSSSLQEPDIREYILDDKYVPYNARKNVQYFESKKTTTLIMPFGTASIESYLSDIRAGKLLVLFPNMEGRYPDIKNLIHFRPSYAEETIALINYVVEKNQYRRCAIFYQNDSFGIGQRDTAHAILREKNIEWVDVPYDRNAVAFSQQAEKIKNADVDMIALFCLSGAGISLIRNIKVYNLVNKKLIGTSDLLTGGFIVYAYLLGLDFVCTSVTPNPEKSTLPIAQEYRASMEKHDFELDSFSFEGYIATQLFLDAFRFVGHVLDPVKLVRYFEGMHNVTFKGLSLSFNKERSLSNNIWIVEGPTVDWTLYKRK